MWLRWYQGTVEDAKFRIVSRNARGTVGTAIAVWATLLEDASHPDHRGVATRGAQFIAVVLGLEPEEVERVLAAMEAVGLIENRITEIIITNWDKRQFETDAIDPTNAERKRRWRAKQQRNGAGTVGNGVGTEWNDKER